MPRPLHLYRRRSIMMEQFIRTQMLLGPEAMERLSAVFSELP